jgi:hypothetical protein
VLVPDKFFQPNLIFARKARSLPETRHVRDEAYLASLSVTKKKMFYNIDSRTATSKRM